MRRRSIVLLVLSLAACPPDPKVATTDGFYGFWRPESGAHTVFAFAAPQDAEALFNLSGNGVTAPGKPVSAVYENHQLVQLATFSATPTELVQEVLADVGSPPGTKFSTRIHAFERGTLMRLASKQDPSGVRTWRRFDFCPESVETGWQQLAVGACPNPVSFAGSGAFDAEGRLFAYASTGSDRSGSCPATPAFLETTGGCGFTVSEAPFARASALGVGPDAVIRLLYVDRESNTRVREKPVGGTEWTDTLLHDSSSVGTFHAVLHPGGVPTVVSNLKDGQGFGVFRKVDGQWQRSPLAPNTFAALSGARLGPDDSLWVLADGKVFHEVAGAFVEVPVPRPPADFFIDPAGRLHALWTGARGLEYAVQTDSGFETHVLDERTSGRIVTHGTRPLRVIVDAPARGPSLPWTSHALITMHDDGRVESELAGGSVTNVLANVSTSWVATGPRGEVAASLTSETAMVRFPTGRILPRSKQFQVSISGGSATVRSADGRYVCSDAQCTFDATLGERLHLRVEPRPGTLATLQSCDRGRSGGQAPCFFSVIDPPNASTAELPHVFSVLTTQTPVARAWAAASSVGWATRASVAGDWLAATVLFQSAATTMPFAGVTVPVTGSFQSQGLLAVNPTTGASWFLAVPSAPSVTSIRAEPNGGLWALVTFTGAAQVGGRSFGSSSTTDLVRLHVDATGAVDQALVVASLPRTSSVVADALLPDGSAAAVVVGATALAALGVTERNALVQVDPAGARTATGFSTAAGVTSALVALDATRVAWVVNHGTGSTLSVRAQGQVATRGVLGGTARALALDATRLVAGFSAAQSLDVEGTVVMGQKHLVRFTDTLAVQKTLSFTETQPTQPTSWAIGLLDGQVGFLSDGTLRWRGDLFEQLSNPIALPSSARQMSGVGRLSSEVDRGRWFVLSPADGLFGDLGAGMAIAQLERF